MDTPPQILSQPFKAYDEFFAPIGKGIVRLSSEQGLELEKYYHEAPIWSLIFRHPKDGLAKVDIQMREDGRVGVYGVWWKDDFNEGTRSLKGFDLQVVPHDDKAVAECAEAIFRQILAHPFGEWSKVVGGYKPLWQPYGPAFIENDEKRHPLPKGAKH